MHDFACGLETADRFNDQVGGLSDCIPRVGRQQPGGHVALLVRILHDHAHDLKQIGTTSEMFVHASTDGAQAEQHDADGLNRFMRHDREFVRTVIHVRREIRSHARDFERLPMRLRELQRSRLNDSTADIQRAAPAEPMKTTRMIGDDCGIAFVHAIHVFQQATAGVEILGEEQRGEITAQLAGLYAEAIAGAIP